MHTRFRVFLVFLILGLLYYWRILIGHQFSLITGYEGANQAYGWYSFLVRSLRSHSSLLWDPYSFAGHPFVAEMQNGTFYPVNLLLAIFPLNNQGVFSPAIYHWMYALTHILGAFFMFLLIRELGLSVFAGFLAGLAFGLGGVVRSGGWAHLIQSFIWFPLIFLFVLRALRCETWRGRALNAATAGGGIALSLLAGGLYSAIMQAILIVATVVFALCQGEPRLRGQTPAAMWMSGLLIIGLAGAVAATGSAAQLLPSMAGGVETLRSVGGGTMLPESQKIPYALISGGMWPHSFITLFLAPFAFNGNTGSGEGVNPYMGVLTFALALIGIWKRWGSPWVRFLTGLAVVSFLYSMAGNSVIHGILYAIVPRLWMAREASRSLYLADFSLAVLCAFGADSLFAARPESWHYLWPVLKWTTIVCGSVFLVAAFFPKLEMSPWVSLSLALIVVVCALLWKIAGGDRSLRVKFLLAAVLVFDLYAFDWSALNVIQERAKNADQLDRLLSLRSAADFLKSRPGPFRAQLLSDPISNLGDTFGIETTWGAAATVLQDYWDYRDVGRIWNTRYSIRPASAPQAGAIYTDKIWKIYEDAGAYPRAWLVHKAVLERSEERIQATLRDPSFDALSVGVVAEPLAQPLAPASPASQDRVDLRGYQAGHPVLNVDADSDALLVVSEVYCRGWRATVNGRPAPIRRVDGALRGISVPRGHSRIEMIYAPPEQTPGLILTLATLLGIGIVWTLPAARKRACDLSPEDPVAVLAR